MPKPVPAKVGDTENTETSVDRHASSIQPADADS